MIYLLGCSLELNCTKALEPIEVLQSRNGGNSKNYVSCNKIAVRQADTKEVGNHFFQVKSEVQESDVLVLKQIYNHNFTES